MIELGRGFSVPSLAELSSLETPTLNCQTEGLLQIRESFGTWQEILNNQDQL
jgi:hypothetical protein